MRRFRALTAVVLLCLGVAGCGGGGHQATTPLDDALGYFAKDAPFVAAVDSNPDRGQLRQLLSFAGGFGRPLVGVRLQNLARLRQLDYARDVKPQLGGPVVIGLARPAAGSGLGVVTVVAMHLNHPLRAKQVLVRQPNVRGRGKTSGVRVFADTDDSRYYAVDGHVLVAASNPDILGAALALKRSENRMRESDFTADLKGLPAGGLVRVSADPRSLIGADPRLRPALDVKWLASLRRMGAVMKVAPSGATVDFHIASDASAIADADLPLAPKAGPLPLIGKRGEIKVGVREPGRLARVAFAIWRAIAAQQVAHFRKLEPLGVNLELQLPRHLAGSAAAAIDPLSNAFAARAQLHDPGDVKAALGPLAPALPDLAAALGIKGLGVAAPEAGENFYAVAKPDGRNAVFGVVGSSLVVANDANRAAGLASEPSHAAPHGITGAAVATVNAREFGGRVLANRLRGPAALFAPLAFGALRDLTGALTISRKGLDGHFRLTIAR